MTVLLLLIDPAIVSVSLVVWAWAALRVAALPSAATPRGIARGAAVVLALVAVGVVLLVVRIAVVTGLATAGWWLVRESVVLGLPLVGVPALGVLVFAVPRLIALLRTAVAFNGIDAMPPSLGLVTGVAVAALVTWRLAHVRHARLATDVVVRLRRVRG